MLGLAILNNIFSMSNHFECKPNVDVKSIIKNIVPHLETKKINGYGKAPINIALSKYWGKRNKNLNLPDMSSISISLPYFTTTEILLGKDQDKIWLNDTAVDKNDPFYKRLSSFLDHFRKTKKTFFEVHTKNEIPTASGLASSASGFAACAFALNDMFDWKLDKKNLSIIARIGSGSACRSIFNGFVFWNKGKKRNGMDSFAEKIASTLPTLRIGIVLTSSQKKDIDSRTAMINSKDTSPFYSQWILAAEKSSVTIKKAIMEKNFDLLARTAEENALALHAVMLSSSPSILYWNSTTVEIIKKVWEARKKNLANVFFTIDAGPNVKLIFEDKDKKIVKKLFPGTIILKPIFD
ncbi:diphosphomevalonate decarboxylase [Candidatus Dependentiae bacterium]